MLQECYGIFYTHAKTGRLKYLRKIQGWAILGNIYIYTFVRFKSSRRIISLLSSHPYPPLFFPSSSSFTLHPTLPRQSSLIIVTRRTASPSLHACTIHGTRSHRPMRNAWREKRGSSAVDDRAWTLAGRSFKSVADACVDALGDSILGFLLKARWKAREIFLKYNHKCKESK